MSWHIETYDGDAMRRPLDARVWTSEGIGTDNEFATAEEACEALDNLLAPTGSWEDGWFRVVSDTGQVWWEGASGCVYCGSTDDPESGPPVIVTETGDAEWAERARLHASDCEWILSRAHTIP